MDRDFKSDVVNDVDHRPWPMPASPWVMTQTWHDLLFAHWPIDARQLTGKVPAAFPLDLFEGQAWIGIVPFRMTNVAPRAVPSLPWVSEFPELNVRTYVRVNDRPGVYFFSLDAASAVAVRTARTLLNLPYFVASMRVATDGEGIAYDSRRKDAPAAELAATYGPTGSAFFAKEGSLDYFLTERYCLYHIDRTGAPSRLEIHHPRWALQPAQAAFARNTMASVHGIDLPDRPPLLHFSRRQDTIAWAPTRLA